MQFKVPQFLEIEDKVVGPWTFREFVYLAGGAGICYVLFKLLGLFFGFIPILIVAGISLTLTYYKPNNKPFINMLQAGLKYATQDKLYIWKRRLASEDDKDKATVISKQELLSQHGNRLNSSKLRDLAWSLDVLDARKQVKNNEGANAI